ncbi:hypothetical protein DYB38_004828 [Aphanomyces astaci]|uniref:Uncharacterized protein n=1 Tax=Aphanomyces astaci TaxID=112090 RepID=A0A397C0U9_APHAT|nr:hypothetical protein DYB36_005779 [Aphanomyces astaci]RHY36116.1 hypothetical protein DYB38_004828 [Aphanomyces astaci]
MERRAKARFTLAKTTVNFPGNSGSEYTARTPVNFPPCKSATWNIGGNTYDGVTSQKANAQGIYDCDKCYYGWGHTVAGKIDPFLSEVEAASAKQSFSMYFVPQNVTASTTFARA